VKPPVSATLATSPRSLADAIGQGPSATGLGFGLLWRRGFLGGVVQFAIGELLDAAGDAMPPLGQLVRTEHEEDGAGDDDEVPRREEAFEHTRSVGERGRGNQAGENR